MITEQHVRITAKMYEIRDTMRRFWGDKYASHTDPFRDAIRRWMKETGKPVMEVGLRVTQAAEQHGVPMDVALAISAMVDEVETPEAAS